MPAGSRPAAPRRRCCGNAARPGWVDGRCRAPARSASGSRPSSRIIETLGYPAYFLTVADVVDLIRGMGVRVAARGSGAG